MILTEFIPALASWCLTWSLPVALFVGLVYYLLSLPVRRQERSRFFLDLIELGLKLGHTPERTVMAVSQTQERSVGPRFHLLAAYLEGGVQWLRALEKVPHLLLPQVQAVLRAGHEIGDLAKVLPAARTMLRDGLSQMRSAINYQIVLFFVLNPVLIFVWPVVAAKVFPVYVNICASFGVKMPVWTEMLFKSSTVIVAIQVVVLSALFIGTILYVGGNRFTAWVERGIYPVTDWMHLRVPWRRKRLLRDFSATLAILLDAGVPEDRALRLAADSTANALFRARAVKVEQRLRQGESLTSAILAFDDSGEFQWRLANACHAQTGFLSALAGWHDALDAKAFQEEQAAAQMITTSMAFLNGGIVALAAIALLQTTFRLGTLPGT